MINLFAKHESLIKKDKLNIYSSYILYFFPLLILYSLTYFLYAYPDKYVFVIFGYILLAIGIIILMRKSIKESVNDKHYI